MAKKIKRKVSQVRTNMPETENLSTEQVEVSAAPASPRSSFARRSPAAVEFNPDYRYVINDLKRIGTLAGIFFAILIFLSFFIR